jgi:hypothetical protein
MKVQTMILTVATVAILAVPGAALAQGQGGWGGGGPGGHGIHGGGGWGGDDGFDGRGLHRLEWILPRLAERLGLEESEVEAVQQILDKAQDDIQHQLDLMRGAVGDVEPGSFHGDDFDADQFRGHLVTTSPFKIEIQVISASAMNAIMFDVLDEEQREMLKGLRKGMVRRGSRGSGGRAGSGS